MNLGNAVAANGARSGTSVQRGAKNGLRVLALWCALLAATLLTGVLFPVDLPQPRSDGPLTVVQALFVVNGLVALALSAVASIARVRGVKLALLLFVSSFLISSAMMQLETLWFNASLKLPLKVVGELVLNSAVVAATAAVVGSALFSRVEAAPQPIPANLLTRIVIMALLYVVLYYSAGFFIAWQSAAVRAYYQNGVHIAFLPTVGFQIFRGTLWALIALYIVSRLQGALWLRALVMGLVFAVMTAAQLLYPTPFFPWEVRSVHLTEVGASEFVYGLLATWILIGGARKRPLSATSRWQIITGKI